MRILMITAAVLALAACNRGAANNSNANKAGAATANAAVPAAPASAPPAATADAGGLPAGFLSDNADEQASACYGFLTVARQAGAQPAGRDGPIMEQAANQWLASVPVHASRSEENVKELFAPMITAMGSVPPAQRDAAAAWCVENAPEPDPEG